MNNPFADIALERNERFHKIESENELRQKAFIEAFEIGGKACQLHDAMVRRTLQLLKEAMYPDQVVSGHWKSEPPSYRENWNPSDFDLGTWSLGHTYREYIRGDYYDSFYCCVSVELRYNDSGELRFRCHGYDYRKAEICEPTEAQLVACLRKIVSEEPLLA
jgi:hypothetical protein